MRRRIVIVLIGLLLLTSCSAKNQHASTETIKIGYLPITHAAPLLLDAHLHAGHDESFELELVKFNSWPDLVDALNAGQIDGASMLMQLAMQAKQIDIDITAVALGHEDGNVIISQKEIDSPAQFKDTTFAIPHTHSAHHLLINELLQQEGMAYDDVNLVEMPPPEMPAALAEGRIAGYAVAEPFGALAVDLDVGKVLAFSESFWPNSYCCVLVLRDELIEENEDLVQQFVDRYVEAGVKANEKGDDLYDALQAHMDVEDGILDLSLEWIAYDSLRIERDEYEKLSDRIDSLQLMENIPTYEQFVDLRFLDRVKDTNE